LDYSPALLQLFHHLARQRACREGIIEDLRVLRMTRVAHHANKHEYRQIEAGLVSALEPGRDRRKKVNRALAQIAKALNGGQQNRA
jgi:hypothetical protein